jgi:hypothetical protein
MAGTYDTSDRYALRALTGSSAVSDIDEGFDFLRDDVSAKLTPFDAGARSSRPRSTPSVPGIAGRTYRSADGGIDRDLGTSWATEKAGLFAALPTLSGNASDGLDEGMEILYQTAGMASALVPPYHLRYDSTLSGTSKWAVISAAPWIAEGAASVALSTTASYVDFSTSLQITLPAAGDYDLTFGLTPGSPGPGAVVYAAPAATGLTAATANAVKVGASAESSVHRCLQALGISGTLKLQYITNSIGATCTARYLTVTPRRLG